AEDELCRRQPVLRTARSGRSSSACGARSHNQMELRQDVPRGARMVVPRWCRSAMASLPGHEFSVVTNLRDHKGTVEQVFVRVTSIRDGLISGKPIMMIAMTLSLNASLRFVGMTSGQGVGSLMVQLAKYHCANLTHRSP